MDWTNKHGEYFLNQLNKSVVHVTGQEQSLPSKDMYESVQNMFLKLYNDGYLYRDKKIVNWDLRQNYPIQ